MILCNFISILTYSQGQGQSLPSETWDWKFQPTYHNKKVVLGNPFSQKISFKKYVVYCCSKTKSKRKLTSSLAQVIFSCCVRKFIVSISYFLFLASLKYKFFKTFCKILNRIKTWWTPKKIILVKWRILPWYCKLKNHP